MPNINSISKLSRSMMFHSSKPPTPNIGDAYFDTTDNNIYVYNGEWYQLNSSRIKYDYLINQRILKLDKIRKILKK